MAAAVKLSNAPFRSVEHALEAAYRGESLSVCMMSSDPRHGAIRSTVTVSPYDQTAQSVFVLGLMRRSLPEQMRDVLDAYYTVPQGITLEGRKECSTRLLSWRLWEQMGQIPDRWYLCDVMRGWNRHGQREHDDAWWAEHLRATRRTLRNWRTGWSEHSGMIPILDALLDGAHGRLLDVYREEGLCE